MSQREARMSRVEPDTKDWAEVHHHLGDVTG